MQFLWPGVMAAQAIHVAAKLKLADLVAAGPKTIEELAETTQTHRLSLGRFLRALTSLGIFAEDAAGRFWQTELSDTLCDDHSESIRHWATMLGAPFIWEPFGRLDETIRTGQPAFERVYRGEFLHQAQILS